MSKTWGNSLDPLHDIDLFNGIFRDTSRQQLAAAFVNFSTTPPADHLCIFFHGGLVSSTDALATARQLVTGYTASGTYPFFFIWNSDLLSVLKAKIGEYGNNP